MAEAVVCASCPETFHDRVAELCLQHQVQKAFGKAGDMVNGLSGKDWIPKWEAKVVMATVTKAQTLKSNKALILCIAGGRNCDAEMARQPALVRAIKTEMANQDFRVRVEWIEIDEFLERYPDARSKAPKSAKENVKENVKSKDAKDGKGGKGTKDGPGGKDAKDKKGEKDPQNGKGATGAKDEKGGKGSKNGKGPAEAKHGKGDAQSGYPRQSAPADRKFCKFWQQGECKNGNECAFLHAQKPHGPLPESKASAKKEKKDKKLPCLECGRAFKDWQDMCSKHFLCKGHKPLCQCAECGKTFSDDIDCAQHQAAKGHKGMARVNDEDPEGWECGQCGKEFDSEKAVTQHQQSTGHGDCPSCLTCGRSFGFGDLKALLQHQMAKGHTGVQWVMDFESDSDEDYEYRPRPLSAEDIKLLKSIGVPVKVQDVYK
mmetsp:Transcript_28674/g.66468  ORF Transcript_28674/g.66468 Transcript_28674/m.66468 type:complete len:431 (-) Transcript_28674:100-1392(-)